MTDDILDDESLDGTLKRQTVERGILLGTVLRDTISNGNWIIRTVPVIFAEFTLFF